MTYELRPYQKQCFESCISYLDSNSKKKVVIVLPCGTGKSLLPAAIADYLKQPIIICQPTGDLLLQNYGKLTEMYGHPASIYSASLNMRNLDNDIIFGTIGSLKSEVQKIKELGVKALILDECDSSSKHGSQISKFLEATGIEKVIGMTASPLEVASWQGQAYMKVITRSRKNIFQEIIHCTQISEIKDKYWSPIIYEQRKNDSSQLRLNTAGTDYLDDTLIKFYTENNLKSRIANEVFTQQNEGRKSILCFVPSVNAAEELSKLIPNSCSVSYKTPKKQRREILEGFKNLEIPTLTNCGLVGIGCDFPQLDTVINGRATNSFRLFYQFTGRGVRPHKDKENYKYIDYTDNTKRFGKLEDIQFIKGDVGWAMMSGENQLTVGNINKDVKPPREQFDGIIWFGIHRGKKLDTLPTSYLKWMLKDFSRDSPKIKQMLLQVEQILQKG